MERIHHYGDTTIVNAFERYDLEVEVPMKSRERDQEIMDASKGAVLNLTDKLKITGRDSLLYTIYERSREQQLKKKERE
ncbi:MAG: hypothetical protein Q4B67_08850, partial [Eubacteriales bacterium]|nr:hypothetical protein [Eubacteriales bacterium]